MTKINAYLAWEDLIKQISSTDEKIILSSNVYSDELTDVIFQASYDEELKLLIYFNEETDNFKLDLTGIKIESKIVPSVDSKRKAIEISNLVPKDNNMFVAFSSTLLDNIESSDKKTKCYIESIKQTILDYQQYFKKDKKNQLSKLEQQGLFGELSFIYDLCSRCEFDSINYWEGVNKNKNDFVFENYSVEIKTTRNVNQKLISISNESQLDNRLVKSGVLYLKVYVLDQVQVGESVIDLCKKILNLLPDKSIQMIFQAKLFLVGLDINGIDNSYKFLIMDTYQYLVDDDFPRIIKDDVNDRIKFIKYKIDIDGIETYKGELNGKVIKGN